MPRGLSDDKAPSVRTEGADRDGVLRGEDLAGEHQPLLIAFSRSQLSGVPAEQVAAPFEARIARTNLPRIIWIGRCWAGWHRGADRNLV